MLGEAIGLGAGAGFAKNLASCTSVESSSPGMGSSWAGFIFLMSLRTVVRMVFGGVRGDWGFIFWEICRVGGKLGVIEGWEGCGSGRGWVSFEMGW